MIQRALFSQESSTSCVIENNTTSAIEQQFPIALVSQLAEHESWRKDVYRPLSYIHKWWARRLGSVFRAILIASNVGEHHDVASLLWNPIQFPNMVVFDPFMGSGVTIHEAVKLGCRVIGRDINPISYTMVRTALQRYNVADVQATFDALAETVGSQIQSFYRWVSPTGEISDILYYFWVKVVPCPCCDFPIDLFKSRIFARHAYPSRYTQSYALCPCCEAVNEVHVSATKVSCQRCGTMYNPQVGVFTGKRVVCPACSATFKVIDIVRQRTTPLEHRMYAKLVLQQNGTKAFLPIDTGDQLLYDQAIEHLPSVWHRIPQSRIETGYNTDQVLNYNYYHWHEMFNARQLTSLGMLANSIAQIPDSDMRQLFACLFSGTLEFNSMFASFKGIGTGAVRPLFSNHILKPELTPLEANLWGTSKSSGSFRTLFESRILRALDYKVNPFEFRIKSNGQTATSRKIYNITASLNKTISANYQEFVNGDGDGVYLSMGDSATTDIASESVDVIVTDPPFFDNVHYSQLADFFFVWLDSILNDGSSNLQVTTRHPNEVQHTDAVVFTERLTTVLCECYRVLKHTGILVFTYHHTRSEGWEALYQAIRTAGFVVTKTHPVKAEMAVSVSIQQTKVPVNIDLIIVCRKSDIVANNQNASNFSATVCFPDVCSAIETLQQAGLKLSQGDVRVVLIGCIFANLARVGSVGREIQILRALDSRLDTYVDAIMRQSTMDQ